MTFSMEYKRGKEFEQIANPNVMGVSDHVYLENLSQKLQVTNGSNYIRKNSYLDKKYYIEKGYKKGTVNTHKDKQSCGIGKGKLVFVKLDGLKGDEK